MKKKSKEKKRHSCQWCQDKKLNDQAWKEHLRYLKFIEWSTPLHQQDIDKDKLQFILEQDLNLKVKITSTNNGFLLDCPKCQTPNKLFYNFAGRQFLCLNYKDCGFKPFNLTKLKREIKKNSPQRG